MSRPASIRYVPPSERNNSLLNRLTELWEASVRATHHFLREEDIENLIVRKGVAYIAIKQQDVVKVVKQGRLEGLKCGKDFGLLAYNDIPSYEVIDEGITSLSIDWEMMGNEAANFVLNNVPVQKFLPTEVRLRKSL